jgi:hypothetical protein
MTKQYFSYTTNNQPCRLKGGTERSLWMDVMTKRKELGSIPIPHDSLRIYIKLY